jgi:hypothetical protein
MLTLEPGNDNTGMVEEFWKNVNYCGNEPFQSFIAKFALNDNQKELHSV